MAIPHLTGIKLIDGSAGAPALAFNSDTNTGIYWNTYSGDAKQLNIAVDGNTRASFNSAGITSYANVYTSSSGQFRNYSGVWKGTTGQSGGDAQFVLNGKTIMHIDEADERVGIGNTDPKAKLHITGSDSTESSIRQSRTGVSKIWDQAIDSSGRLAWGHRASEGGTRTTVLTIDDDNKVGIMRDAPLYPLHVVGSAYVNQGSLFIDSGNRLKWGNSNQFIEGTNDTSLEFGTGGGTKMIILNNGNVGINNTNPSRKLIVNGTTQFYEYSGAHLTNNAHSTYLFDTLVTSSDATNGGGIGAYVKLASGATNSSLGDFNAIRTRAYAENTTVNVNGLINFYAEYRNFTSTSSVTLGSHYGLKVDTLGVGGSATVNNNYGVYLNPGTAATNNYGVFQAGGSVKNKFEGPVGINTVPAAGVELHVNGEIRCDSTSGVATRQIRSSYFSSSSDITVMSGSSGNVLLKNGNSVAATIDTSEAEFTGIVSVPTGKAFRMYNSAGSGWGELTLNETDNKIQFNRGITPSGNLQADQLLGISTKRWHTLYAGAVDLTGDISTPGQINLPGDGTTSSFETLIYAHGSRGKLMKQGNAVFWQVAQGSNQFEITDAANGNSTKGNVLLRTNGHDNYDNKLILVPDGGSVGIDTPIPFTANSNANRLVIGSGSGNQGMTIYSGDSNSGSIYFADDLDEEGAGDGPAGNRDGVFAYSHNNSQFDLKTGGNQSALTVKHTTSTFQSALTVNQIGKFQQGLQVLDSNGSNHHVRLASNATEGFLTVSNGSNWGLIMRGPGNDPRIGAYHGGVLKIEGFHSSDGATGDNAIDFAQFNFGADQFQMNASNSYFNTIWIPDYIKHTNDDNTYFGFEANDQFRIVVGAVEKIHINSTRIRVNDDIIPAADSTYNIGESATRHHYIYADYFSGDGSNLTNVTADAPTNMVTTNTDQTVGGRKTFSDSDGVQILSGNQGNAIRLVTNNYAAQIADSFSGNTVKSYIYFDAQSSSNDPGYIMHETSASESNEGVLHLCPSDDNSTGDYVSIHGTNDPDVLKLHTTGLIETVNLALQLKSGLNDIYLNDSIMLGGNINADTDSSYNIGSNGTRFATVYADYIDGGNSTLLTSDASNYFRINTSGGSAQLGLFRTGSSAGGGYIGIDVNKFRVYNSSFSEKFSVDISSGNINSPGSITATSLDINGNADISGTTNLGTTNFDGLLSWSGSDYASAINLSEGNINNVNQIAGYEFKQRATGEPRNNLGDPTVTEMALFEQQFKPQTTLANNYDNLADLKFFKQDTSSSSWTEITSYSDDQKRKFLRTMNSSVIIPNGVYKFRVEFVGHNYTFANALSGYWSSQSHNTQVHIWKKRCDNNNWYQHTSSTTTISSWPGHMYLPFSTIAWHETNTTSSGHFNTIRIEFTPNWIPYSGSGTDYSDRDIILYGLQIWGGYPSGRRTVHNYDQNGKLDLFKDLGLPDSGVATFGNSDDLKIYHDGSNSYIEDSGSGNLKIRTNALNVMNAANSENMLSATNNGSVSLYYDNSLKFQTTTGGASVSGNLAVSGTVDGIDIGNNVVTLDGTQEISGAKNFTSVSNQFNGHIYFNAYDANGNHYPHFRDGSNSNGANVNIRQYYGSANYKTHVMSSDSSGNMQFDFQGTLKGDALTIDGNSDLNGNLDVSGNLTGISTMTIPSKLTVGSSNSSFSHRVDITTASDAKMRFYTPSSDSSDWNYIEFYTRSNGRSSYFGINGSGDPVWAVHDGGPYIKLEESGDNITAGGNLTVTGNLQVNGTTTTVNQTNLNISDNIIGLNRGASSNANDSGLIIERGSTGDNATFLWDESADKFVFGTTTSDAGSTGNISFTPAAFGGKGLWTTTSAVTHWGPGVDGTAYGTLTWDTGYAAVHANGSNVLRLGSGSDTDAVIIDGSNMTVAGNVSHTGLTMTSGSDIDQVYSANINLQLVAETWTDIGVSSNAMATGTYAVQIYASDFNLGGGHYYEYYSGTMSYYGSGTNSTATDEVVLHRAGHAPNNGHIQLRTERHGSGVMQVQIKHNSNYNAAADQSGGKELSIKFRRLI